MADVLSVPSGHESQQPDASAAVAASEPTVASRKVAAPAPNPNFSFPMIPLDQVPQSINDLLPVPPRTGTRPRPANISVNNVAAPWGTLPPSPTKLAVTPDSVHSSPTRGGSATARSAHKRGGSEFIGGDGSTTGPGLMSASPTKGEGALSSIPASGRRRGHAHRRSGAISHHDLSAILKPSTHEPLPTRPGSMPSTPTGPNPPHLSHAASQPSFRTTAQSDATPPATPSRANSKSAVASPPTTRPRVGFSDTVEFIPRPLSTISSETSSSLSTIRASHSGTGSITSIMSMGTPSPSSTKKSQYTADILQRYRYGETGPRGAESPTQNRAERRGSPPPPPPPPPQSSSTSHPPQPLGAFGYPASGSVPNLAVNRHPTLLQGFEASRSVEQLARLPSPPHSAAAVLQEFAPPPFPAQFERPRSSPEAKVTKKQRKGKSWAGSLLSRKAKGKMPEELTSPTSVSREHFASIDDFSLDDVNFDEDNTYVIKSPDYTPQALPNVARTANSARHHDSDEDPDADDSAAVLDLDATWEELDENEKASQSAAAKKRMHSGNAAAFTGPGTQYHRRAESAPALTPISSTTGLHRLGSNPQMADVFEEEEEEDAHASPASSLSRAESTEGDDSDSEAEPCVDGKVRPPTPPGPRSKREIPPALDADRMNPNIPHSEIQTPRDMQAFMDETVEIVDTVDEPRFSVVTKSSDESTITPTLRTPNGFPEVTTPLGQAEGSTPPASSHGTSHISFEGPLLKTAASSITDRSTWSSSKNEAAPTMSYSTEDVPSLTSSASTTFSGYHAQTSPIFAEHPPAERSYSFSGIPPRPLSAVKRSSLASLSRLVSSSHGTRSKLSLEVYSQADDEETAEKKKRNRISRLMRFWRPKDKAQAVDL